MKKVNIIAGVFAGIIIYLVVSAVFGTLLGVIIGLVAGIVVVNRDKIENSNITLLADVANPIERSISVDEIKKWLSHADASQCTSRMRADLIAMGGDEKSVDEIVDFLSNGVDFDQTKRMTGVIAQSRLGGISYKEFRERMKLEDFLEEWREHRQERSNNSSNVSQKPVKEVSSASKQSFSEILSAVNREDYERMNGKSVKSVDSMSKTSEKTFEDALAEVKYEKSNGLTLDEMMRMTEELEKQNNGEVN